MVELRNGDTLRCACTFQHKGKAYSGAKVYVAIGKKGSISFNEAGSLHQQATITGIKDDAQWTSYAVEVNISISGIGGLTGISPGTDYELYGKLISIPGSDIYWEGPLDDISLLEDSGFSGLSVQYSKA